MDLVPAEALTQNLETYQSLLNKARVEPSRNEAQVISISATQNLHLDDLRDLLISLAPIRPPEYDEEQVTDSYERDIAADLIREACLLKLRDEVPHGVGVRIDEFAERENGMLYIAATIFVERESQKGIVIGEGGKMLKQIGSAARREIEEMGGRPVFLELRVKVLKDWRNNEEALKRLGYKIDTKKKKRISR
jgi:GTP-binding protein Era